MQLVDLYQTSWYILKCMYKSYVLKRVIGKHRITGSRIYKVGFDLPALILLQPPIGIVYLLINSLLV